MNNKPILIATPRMSAADRDALTTPLVDGMICLGKPECKVLMVQDGEWVELDSIDEVSRIFYANQSKNKTTGNE